MQPASQVPEPQPSPSDIEPDGPDDTRERVADYTRYSSDNQNETSIEDQYSGCQGGANRLGFYIPSEYHYADFAISGTKLKRAGLQQMLRDAEAGKFRVVFFWNLARLGRESAITVPMLKKLVYVDNVRFISVTEGVDSNQPNWEMLATILNVYSEQYIRQLAIDVSRGLQGNIARGFSCGDLRFGYTSIISPSGEMAGRGRNARPKMVYAIYEDEALWVRRIFDWFTVEGRSPEWIARELSRLEVPRDRRSHTKFWASDIVRGVLRSTKYVGVWPWGKMKNVRNPLDGTVKQVPRPESETANWLRYLPDLRIISNEQYDIAKHKLQASTARYARKRDKQGRLRGRPIDGSPRHMLEGLIVCKRCGAAYHTCGVAARYMGCKEYKRGRCSNSTTLPRKLAEKMLLDFVSREILSNPDWRQQIIDATDAAARLALEMDPQDEARLVSQIESIDRKKQRLLDRVEEGEADPDLLRRLADRRAEKVQLDRQLHEIRSRQAGVISAPTPEWVDQQLAMLADILGNGTPAAWLALRRMFVGPVEAEGIVQSGGKRGFVRARIKIRKGRLVQSPDLAIPVVESKITDDGDLFADVSIDFRERTKTEDQGEIAWQRRDEGRLDIEIAAELGISRSRVNAVLKAVAKERGVALPDGRARRHTLTKKSLVPTLAQQKTEEIMDLFGKEMLLGDIAQRLGIDRNTVTRAIRDWHQQQGLDIPDGRTRRKTLEQKSSRPRAADANDAA